MMKIIISPAKKMNITTNIEAFSNLELPYFIEQSESIKCAMQELSFIEAKKLWKCNDKIAELNYIRFQEMNLYGELTPAILSYEGLQYQYMAPAVFESAMLEYIQKHLRILSGFYGVLRPMDGVVPYRLEMQSKLPIQGCKNLYEYWGQSLYDHVVENPEGKPTQIINLASKEYAICIEKYVRPEDTYITCVFGEIINDKVVQKGTFAKMARGEMVRFMAEHQIEDVEELKEFRGLGYRFSCRHSSNDSYVFVRNSGYE